MNRLPLLIPVFLVAPLLAEDSEPVKLPPQVLTNQGVVALSDAGYDEDFLIDLIQIRQVRFDITAAGLAYLAQHGLCEHVVRAMIARANSHDSHPVAAAVAAIPFPVGPARQKMPPAPAALQAGVQMFPMSGTVLSYGAGFPVTAPAPAAVYQVERHRRWLFWHRSYVVPAQPALPSQRVVTTPTPYGGLQPIF